jgi:hypothetical protein
VRPIEATTLPKISQPMDRYRRAAVHQGAHGRMVSAQGVHQARRQLSPAARAALLFVLAARLGVRFTQEPLEMGGVTTAVFDDTYGNLIQIAKA